MEQRPSIHVAAIPPIAEQRLFEVDSQNAVEGGIDLRAVEFRLEQRPSIHVAAIPPIAEQCLFEVDSQNAVEGG
ncbi:hypothetical protein VDQ94_03390, partial [Xanthomonas campestris pv. campestris]|nr:hypothetical protein [Xanthomonas campestris pv. campestris]